MLIFGDFVKSPCHPKGRLPKLDLPRDLDSVNVLSRLEVKELKALELWQIASQINVKKEEHFRGA